MGLARGLVSSVQNLLGQIVTALKFTSTQASGSDGFAATTNGARWHFGTGANDYASSDGTTVTFAGPVTVTKLTSSGGEIVGSYVHPGTAAAIDVAGTKANGATAIGSRFSNTIPLTTAGAKIAAFFPDNFVTEVAAIDKDGQYIGTSYTDDSATPGNRTVNTVRGKNAIAIGAAACTITNSFVTANSQILVTLEFGDATATTILRCIPGAGSFVLTVNANATAATKFGWFVIN